MSTNNTIKVWKRKETRNQLSLRLPLFISVLLFVICCCNISSVWAQAPAPVNGDIIPGEYIVVFKKTAELSTPTAIRALAESLVVSYGGQMLSVYEYAAPGFAAKLSARAVSVLQADPRVELVEPNRVI